MIKHIINQASNCVPFWQPQKVCTLVGTASENTYMARCVQEYVHEAALKIKLASN